MITGITEEGIKYAVRNAGNAVAYCALSVKAGTADEAGFHTGIAHFVEHTLFKGTARHDADYINNRLERLGGELNAYTTKEEIVLHATVLKKDIAKAASLLAEIAFESTFPEEEIEVEKGVVIDEIASYKDSPSEDIYDVFEEKLFAGSPLSSLILGTPESVQAMDSEELRRFRTTFFTPGRISFTVVGPLPEKKMEEMVRSISAKYRNTCACGAKCPERKASDIGDGTVFDETIDKKDHQVNCLIGGTAPSMNSEEDRLATILLCNMLGGPASNSILGRILRERHGWVYNVECSYTPYSDSGVAIIAFGCDGENLPKCERVIRRQLHLLQDRELSRERLKAAKRQLLGQNAISLESGEAQCLSMGRSLMCFGRISPDEELTAKVMAITAAKVREMAVKVFGDHKLSRLVYL
ncbi:MAG: insulinase family protein [Bacteroidales bacterium]|nr:insulinase family protein [Bacteroidales bacterium]